MAEAGSASRQPVSGRRRTLLKALGEHIKRDALSFFEGVLIYSSSEILASMFVFFVVGVCSRSLNRRKSAQRTPPVSADLISDRTFAAGGCPGFVPGHTLSQI